MPEGFGILLNHVGVNEGRAGIVIVIGPSDPTTVKKWVQDTVYAYQLDDASKRDHSEPAASRLLRYFRRRAMGLVASGTMLSGRHDYYS